MSKNSSKKDRVVALLRSKSGATVPQIAEVTGWQTHSIRAAMPRLRQEGYEIGRDSGAGPSRYRIASQRTRT